MGYLLCRLSYFRYTGAIEWIGAYESVMRSVMTSAMGCADENHGINRRPLGYLFADHGFQLTSLGREWSAVRMYLMWSWKWSLLYFHVTLLRYILRPDFRTAITCDYSLNCWWILLKLALLYVTLMPNALYIFYFKFMFWVSWGDFCESHSLAIAEHRRTA